MSHVLDNHVDHVRVSQASRAAARGKRVDLVSSEPTIEESLANALDDAFARLQAAEAALGATKDTPYNTNARKSLLGKKELALRGYRDAKEKLSQHRTKYAILSPNSREVVEALIEHVKMLREEVNRLGGKVPAFHPQHIKHDRSNP